jgi:hypothetical protein
MALRLDQLLVLRAEATPVALSLRTATGRPSSRSASIAQALKQQRQYDGRLSSNIAPILAQLAGSLARPRRRPEKILVEFTGTPQVHDAVRRNSRRTSHRTLRRRHRMKRTPWATRSLSILIALLLNFLTIPAAFAAGSELILGSGRVVLVPPNLGVRATAEVEPGVEPVWQQILQHFAAQQRPATALERKSAGVLWNEVMREVQSRPDADVYQAYALFARRIAEQVDYTAIVFPSLVTRVAKLSGKTAAWDGVRRRVTGSVADRKTSNSSGSDLYSSETFRGEIAAASLHVAVLSPDGELRFEGAGGLSLLQQLEPGNAREDEDVAVELREDAFSDPVELREGVEAAFRRSLPASTAH